MLPKLRKTLRNVSFRNQALQDIYSTCQSSKTVVSISPTPVGIVHNTRLITILNNNEERVTFYNRVDISTFLHDIDLKNKTLEQIVTLLNTQHGCDFDLEDDLEIMGIYLKAKSSSLGYIGQVEIGEVEVIHNLQTFPVSSEEYLQVTQGVTDAINPYNNPNTLIISSTPTDIVFSFKNLEAGKSIGSGFSFDKVSFDKLLNSSEPDEKIVIKTTVLVNGVSQSQLEVPLGQMRTNVSTFTEYNGRYYMIDYIPSMVPMINFKNIMVLDLSYGDVVVAPETASTEFTHLPNDG